MNLAVCSALARGPETRVWYRAIELQFWQTALQTSHTKEIPSRFSEGPGAVRPFEVLYLAEDHQTALFEVEALLGSPFPSPASTVIANPQRTWTVINTQVALQRVADLTRTSKQALLNTTAQELTGDWRGYLERRPHDSVNQPVGTAPTQALGRALFALPGLEGFRTPSAKLPARMVLVVFPRKLLRGSAIVFSDNLGNTHRIEPRRKQRRHSP